MADRIYFPPDPTDPPSTPDSEVGRITVALDALEARIIQEVTDLFARLDVEVEGIKDRLDDIGVKVNAKIDELAARR